MFAVPNLLYGFQITNSFFSAFSCTVKVDREGGRPLEIRVKTLDVKGFTAKSSTVSDHIFIPPCVFYSWSLGGTLENVTTSLSGTTEVIDW